MENRLHLDFIRFEKDLKFCRYQDGGKELKFYFFSLISLRSPRTTAGNISDRAVQYIQILGGTGSVNFVI
jgi:hypothetical protein